MKFILIVFNNVFKILFIIKIWDLFFYIVYIYSKF